MYYFDIMFGSVIDSVFVKYCIIGDLLILYMIVYSVI